MLENELYCSRPETLNLDRAQAPRIADHKSPYIVNSLRLIPNSVSNLEFGPRQSPGDRRS